MAESNPFGSKGRILFLLKYLEKHTDDDHVITTEELIRLYRENGYRAQRQAVADDVAVLTASGIDVIIEQVPRNRTKTNAYHLGARLFELSELKMLVDAVASSRFITAEKSDQLIRRLSQLTNEENADALQARMHIGSRLKTTNPNVFVNIDVVCSALRNRKKITFNYWDYTPDKEKVLRHEGETYVASPYALIWDHDRYYVPSYSHNRQKPVIYRIDRMCNVSETQEDALVDPDFNEAEFSRKVIRMFSDELEEKTVILRCRNEFMKNVIDRFGEGTDTEITDEESFRARVSVVPSSTFFGWVLQYKGGILIENPADVRQNYEDLLSSVLDKQAGL